MTIVIGLTGGIASGKSTVANRLRQLNIPVIDADIIAREVVAPGERAYNKIVTTFGTDILKENRTIDRKKLGAIVFNKEDKRNQLNEIVHPEVRKEMLKQRDELVKKGEKSVVLDIPLLFESKLTYLVDKVIVVYVDKNTQIERLMRRNQFTLEEAKNRINAQTPLDQKVSQADVVINNNGTKEETYMQVNDLIEKWALI